MAQDPVEALLNAAITAKTPVVTDSGGAGLLNAVLADRAATQQHKSDLLGRATQLAGRLGKGALGIVQGMGHDLASLGTELGQMPSDAGIGLEQGGPPVLPGQPATPVDQASAGRGVGLLASTLTGGVGATAGRSLAEGLAIPVARMLPGLTPVTGALGGAAGGGIGATLGMAGAQGRLPTRQEWEGNMALAMAMGLLHAGASSRPEVSTITPETGMPLKVSPIEPAPTLAPTIAYGPAAKPKVQGVYQVNSNTAVGTISEAAQYGQRVKPEGPGYATVVGTTPLDWGHLDPPSMPKSPSAPVPPEVQIVESRGLLDRLAQTTFGKMLRADAPPRELLDGAVTSAKSYLERMGESGAQLGGRIRLAYNRGALRASGHIKDLHDAMDAFGKMSVEEAQHITKVLEGHDLPINDAETKLVTAAQTMLGNIADRSKAAKLRIWTPPVKDAAGRVVNGGYYRDWVERRAFFPHIFTDESIAKLAPEQLAAITKRLQEVEMARNTTQALKVLKSFSGMGGTPEVLQRNLQMSRISDLPGYETDFRKVLPSYLWGANQRIEAAMEFGADHGQAQDLINQVAAAMGPEKGQSAKAIYNAFVGYRPWAANKTMADFARRYRNASMLELLSPTAALKHFSQLNNTVARTGFVPTLQALTQFMGPEGRDFAMRASAGIRDMIPDVMSADLGKASARWADWIGLRTAVRNNRMLAALAGRAHADDVAERFYTQTQVGTGGDLAARLRLGGQAPTAELGKDLMRLGIDPQQVLEQRGALTRQQQLMAARNVLSDTQLMSEVLDRPKYSNTLLGQFGYIFKSAMLQQSTTINREVMRPLIAYFKTGGRAGSYGPALRYAAASGTFSALTGEALQAVREIRTGTPRKVPANLALRAWQDVVQSGALALFADDVEQAITPLPFSDALTLAKAIDEAKSGNVVGAVGTVASRALPYGIGPRVGKMLNPPANP